MENTQNTENVTFTKVMGKWVITGPAALIVEGATVTATKANGTETRVYIRFTSTMGAKPGMVIGHFTDAAEREEQLAADAAQAAFIEQERIAHATKIIEMEKQIAAREEANNA